MPKPPTSDRSTFHLGPIPKLCVAIALLLAGFVALTPAARWPMPTADDVDLSDAGPVARARSARIAAAVARLPSAPERLLPAAERPMAPEARNLFELGTRQRERGRRLDALESLVDALQHDDAAAETWTETVRTLRTLGRSPEALNVIESLGEIESHLPLLRQRAMALEAVGQPAEAAEDWRQVVAALQAAGESRSKIEPAEQRLWSSLYRAGQVDSETPPRTLREPLASRLRSTPSGDGARSHPNLRATVEPPQRIDTGGTTQAAETHLSRSASGEIVLAWNDLREPGGADAWSLGAAISLDDGTTWSDQLVEPAGNQPEDFEGDPMTAYDPRTGNLWVGGISFFPARSVFVARKRPGNATFDPAVILDQGQPFDKGFLAAGPLPGNPNSTRLVATYNLGIQVSDDLGSTWSPTVALPFGLNYQPRFGPTGELYISYWDFDDGIWLLRSFDGGDTFDPPIRVATRIDFWDTQDGSRFPGRFRVPALAFLAVSPVDGRLGLVYFDTTSVQGDQTDVDVYFTRSLDQGATWSTPVVVHGDSVPGGDQFFPWLEIDATGRHHLAFFDTRHTTQNDDQETGFFDVTYATSSDGVAPWTEARLTSNPFQSDTATWPGFEQFLGDFISLIPTDDGGALVAYPATFDGDLDIYLQRVRNDSLFIDGFESGDTSAWSTAAP